MMDLPNEFILSIQSILGDDGDAFLSAHIDEPTVSIRLNPIKTARNPKERNQKMKPVAWSKWGYYINSRPAFTFDPFLHAGYYYVQEASSMFVEHVIRELFQKPVACLDLCAAPGGKSLSILSALPEGSVLVSNEVLRQRANVLSETISKSGYDNVVVTNNKPDDFSRLPDSFDLILVDAPCSGEGMFRKDVMSIKEWSPHNVKMCAVRQKDIINDVWTALKPGGILIYSTCTYNLEENEKVIIPFAHSTGSQFIEVSTNSDWSICPLFDDKAKGYRFFPHHLRGEGLFLCILRKPGSVKETLSDLHTRLTRKKTVKQQLLYLRNAYEYSSLFQNPESLSFINNGGIITALPNLHSDYMLFLGSKLKCVSMGIEVGEIKGKSFVPAQALALSQQLNRDAFVTFPLAYNQAVDYLRKEALVLPDDVPNGHVLLTYENEPLGFVKNLGNRANNLYPNEWRIRSSHIPDVSPRLFFSNL